MESIRIWKLLKDARSHEYKVKEETITDIFVLALKKASSKGGFIVNTFTRPEEKMTGADWEIWIQGLLGGWVGVRVQAKIISIDGKRYDHLHYISKDGTVQLNQLVADARRTQATPVYCLYSYWEKVSGIAAGWPCPSFSKNVKYFGAGILSVSEVKALKAVNDRSLAGVVKHLKPLYCLFCCKGRGGKDLADRVALYLRGMEFSTEGDGLLLIEPPNYVLEILEGNPEFDLVGIEDNNLRRVTVVREKGPE